MSPHGSATQLSFSIPLSANGAAQIMACSPLAGRRALVPLARRLSPVAIEIMIGLPHLREGPILNRARAMQVPTLISANASSRWNRGRGWPEWRGWRLDLLKNADGLSSLSLDSAGSWLYPIIGDIHGQRKTISISPQAIHSAGSPAWTIASNLKSRPTAKRCATGFREPSVSTAIAGAARMIATLPIASCP
jgi:hypothetical protein